MPRRSHTLQPIRRARQLLGACVLAAVATAFGIVPLCGAPAAGAASVSPFAASWCAAGGATVVGWTGTTPNLPICGIGPAYGGSTAWIDIPGPYGAMGTYYNATDGFQCVELAERYLAVDDGLAPVKANGGSVAANYHAAYPNYPLVVNGTPGAVGHAPRAGDVISFSEDPSFEWGDGHVAIVVQSSVDAAGDGTIVVAQENVSPGDYLRTLGVSSWRLYDPAEPGDAEYQFPDAEWLVIPLSRPASASLEGRATPSLLVQDATPTDTALPRFVAVRRAGHPHPATSHARRRHPARLEADRRE